MQARRAQRYAGNGDHSSDARPVRTHPPPMMTRAVEQLAGHADEAAPVSEGGIGPDRGDGLPGLVLAGQSFVLRGERRVLAVAIDARQQAGRGREAGGPTGRHREW